LKSGGDTAIFISENFHFDLQFRIDYLEKQSQTQINCGTAEHLFDAVDGTTITEFPRGKSKFPEFRQVFCSGEPTYKIW
jgi:hypothetical protein